MSSRGYWFLGSNQPFTLEELEGLLEAVTVTKSIGFGATEKWQKLRHRLIALMIYADQHGAATGQLPASEKGRVTT